MKKTIIVIAVIIIISIIGFSLYKGNGSKIEYVTVSADYGAVVQTVDATGSVSSAEEINLNFRSTGRISSIKVSNGDQVVVGQLLASLESSSLQSKVDDAASALLEAEANLEQLLAGSTEEDIKIKEINLEQKEQALKSAKTNLDNLTNNQAIELENLKNTVIITANNEIISAQSALEKINNTLNDKDAKATLGVLDSERLHQAEDSYSIALDYVNNADLSMIPINNNSLYTDTIKAVNSVSIALDYVRDSLSLTHDVLELTITSGELTQAELDSLISDIQTKQSAISTSRSSLQTVKSNWTNKIAYYDDQIDRAKDSITSAEDAVQLAQAELVRTKAGPQSYEIKAYQAKVERAQANLNMARSNLNDTVITAPVNGTITRVNYELGEQTTLADPVLQMIGQSNLEIEVDIPESDITKIKIGQPTEITLDAYSDDQIFNGSVTFINPAETIIQDVVYYQVKVQFDQKNNLVKPGMTANVNINTNSKKNVIRIPFRALKRKNGDQYVELLVDGEVKEQLVTPGLKGDEYIEIATGVKAGDNIITFTKEK